MLPLTLTVGIRDSVVSILGGVVSSAGAGHGRGAKSSEQPYCAPLPRSRLRQGWEQAQRASALPYLGMSRKRCGSMFPYAAVMHRSGARASIASRNSSCSDGGVLLSYERTHGPLDRGFGKPPPRRHQQDWILKSLQGACAHHLAACGVATACCRNPSTHLSGLERRENKLLTNTPLQCLHSHGCVFQRGSAAALGLARLRHHSNHLQAGEAVR